MFAKKVLTMNDDIKKHRLLIICNNVLSKRRGNGKTVYSFFDYVPCENVHQIYFSKEVPSISGYEYYQITDEDVLKGLFNRNNRGRLHSNVADIDTDKSAHRSTTIKKPFFRLIREVIWCGHWKSPNLERWLDSFVPTDVFLVGGDSGFAYTIAEYITKKYGARFSLYITDDYVMKRTNEGIAGRIRRQFIIKKMRKCINDSDAFFTISNPMRIAYNNLFGKDSITVSNIPDNSIMNDYDDTSEKDYIKFIYAGSFYLGRDKSIAKIVDAISEYNDTHDVKAKLFLYSNTPPTREQETVLIKNKVSVFGGSLSKDALEKELRTADVLVFVESFDKEQIEITRFSLSTKVSEYLAAKKPILALGPSGIGSMDYLQDVALCVNNINNVYSAVEKVISSKEYRIKLSDKAFSKYKKNHVKGVVQSKIGKLVFGVKEM